MYDNYKWIFPNGAVKNYGINNSIETFKDTPIPSLGREICQNSGDVRVDNQKPVVVEFKSFKIKTDAFPDIDGFRYAINRCNDFWKNQNNPKADAFFKNAKKTVDADEITVLRISDHNTCGLDGADRPDDTNAHWTSLVMSSGTSTKDGTEGGSFGIGKFAAFANSRIRTVFYNTVDTSKNRASQGIAYLASFMDKDGSKTFGEGYCGDNTKPVFSEIEFEKNYHRTDGDAGTDIYIMGFADTPGWKNKLIGAILDGFLYAIDQKMLVVQIDDVRIDDKELDTVLEKYKTHCQNYTIDYYKVLRSDAPWISLSDYDGNEDSMMLKLVIAQGLSRRVAMVRRTGMKILDRSGFNSNIMFSGFMYIKGEKANKYLTSLENPAHTGWYPERDEDPERAKKYLADLRGKIREELNKLIAADFSGEVIPEMGNMLQSISREKGDSNPQEVLSDDSLEIKAKPKRKTEVNTQFTESDAGGGGDEEGDEGGKDHGTDRQTGGGGGYGTGNGGSGSIGGGTGDSSDGSDNGNHSKMKNRNIELKTRRVIAVNKNEGVYILKIKPAISSDNANLDINIVAEDGTYVPEILSFSVKDQPDAVLKKNTISNITVTGDATTIINIRVDTSDYTSFEVKCYETEE